MTWLRRKGIGAVLSLTETPLPSVALTHHVIEALHLPVDDLRAPTPAQLDRALDLFDEQRGRGRAVAVHCRMGQGRTGTVLAACLIRGGLGPATAITQIRRICAGAICVSVQEDALTDLSARADWLL